MCGVPTRARGNWIFRKHLPKNPSASTLVATPPVRSRVFSPFVGAFPRTARSPPLSWGERPSPAVRIIPRPSPRQRDSPFSFSPPMDGSSSLLILLAKSETCTIQGQHALVNSACQPASPRQNDFAISITFGDKGGYPRYHARSWLMDLSNSESFSPLVS
jgi:hypothetical protein